MLSLLVWPKVIPLSGFYCITKNRLYLYLFNFGFRCCWKKEQITDFLMLLESVCVKALHKTLMKLTPCMTYKLMMTTTHFGHFVNRSMNVCHELSNGRFDIVCQNFHFVLEPHRHRDQSLLRPLFSKKRFIQWKPLNVITC